jgi:hypothetical protein
MSLDWSTEACVRPLPDNDEEKHFRTTLIFATLHLGLGDLTDENLSEWIFRMFHSPRPTLELAVIDRSVPRQEMEAKLRRWIGLRTNMPTLSREEWLASKKQPIVECGDEECWYDQPEEED